MRLMMILPLLLAAPSAGAGADSVPEWQARAMAERVRLSQDTQRPLYHFLPPSNWMNDPNGLVHFKGEYHLFYQHNPQGAAWGNMTWGHAVSKDLVHWRDLPYALRPDADYDREGVFSGCCVVDNGLPTIVYTGVQPEVQCVATSRDMLVWTKSPNNPVIPGPPPGLEVTGFRDPYVWREGKEWRAVVGSGIKGRGGAILLYRSKDLRTWDFVGPALVGDPGLGDMWECPNLFRLGRKWVLIVSTLGRAHYFVGDFADDRFVPESDGPLDNGGALYAPQVFPDNRGRRILFGWLWEQRAGAETHGWQGVQSLPRVLTLGEDGSLRYAPAREVEKLRGARTRVERPQLAPDKDTPLPAIAGDCLEIQADFRVKEGRCGLVVRRSPDAEEGTRIVYDAGTSTLSVDRSRSSTDPRVVRDVRSAPLALGKDEALRLRVFVDRSVIEVFANERVVLTSRVYPVRSDSLGVAAFGSAASTVLERADAWTMEAIWPRGEGPTERVSSK
jgi:beta-fructofuranosidase